MKSDRDTPPAADELEVSIFGPGYGECIVVHYGDGNWLIIDSCIDPEKKPVALSYLQRLGVDPSKAVKLVAATHWHDDHVRGLSSVVKGCSSAFFCCSSALKSQDFINLSQIYATAPIDMPAGPQEFNNIFTILKDRRGESSYKPIKWSHNDQVILRQEVLLGSEKISVTLHSLSPSDEMLTKAAEEIAQHYEKVRSGIPPGRLVPNHPNHVSVAMNLKIGTRSVLLGSDLEQTGNPLTGWAAVCSSFTREPGKSQIYKVAHHASASGHHEEIWQNMLDDKPISFITPFKNGVHKIPTIADQSQILALTDKAYLTANPQLKRAPPKRSPKIEATLKAATIERRRSIDFVGQIRLRAPILNASDAGSISLYDGAYLLA